MRTMDQVLESLKIFHVVVDREIRKKLKCVHANNSSEHRVPFEEYCRVYGIKYEKTMSKTPQHNGAIERMNHIINDKIKCILFHTKLLKSF